LARKPSFSRHLRDARIQRGLSVAEVASRVGVSAPCVYFWEMGRTRPRDGNLSALCKVLKLPVKATKELAAA
jgi:transcriptional regulator with XRE-family HTH domain